MHPARDTGAARATTPPSRRAILASTAAALLAGGAVTTLPSADDSALLHLLHQHRRADALVAAIAEEGHRLPDGITPASKDQERRLAEAMDAREDMWERFAATPAKTSAGMQAKAEALGAALLLYTYAPARTLDDLAETGELHERLALSLARDVMAGRAVA